MQKEVELKLEEIFEDNIAKIQGDTVKITVSTVKGNQLYDLGELFLTEGVKNVELKRSGTNITVLVTINE